MYISLMSAENRENPNYPKTTRGFVTLLESSMSTLERDTLIGAPMPKKGGVDTFVTALRKSFLEDLAETIEIVRKGELGYVKDSIIPHPTSLARFVTRRTHAVRKNPDYLKARAVFEDLSRVVTENRLLLDREAYVKPSTYKGSQTKIGDLVLSFYDISQGTEEANRPNFNTFARADTLSRQPGFVLSPMMEKTISDFRKKHS